MKIGIILVCRTSSSRLKNKIFKKLAGLSIIEIICHKIRKTRIDSDLIVATSENENDDKVEDFCKRNGIKCFRGDESDVAGRILECSKKFKLDFFVRINGDNVFVDTDALRSMISIAQTGQYDIITNVPKRTFGFGRSIEIVSTKLLNSVYFKEDFSISHKEHVTQFFYEKFSNFNSYIFENKIFKNLKNYNFSLDTETDLKNINQIIINLGKSPLEIKSDDLDMYLGFNDIPKVWKGNCGPMLIAEIGGNHEGNFQYANEILDLALQSKSDCIKFQLYKGDSLVSVKENPDRNKHFKKFELSKKQHIELAKKTIKAGKIYNASVWDLEMLEWIDDYLDFYKIGSGDLTNWHFIKQCTQKGKPILLSTGLSDFNDISSTINFIRSCNKTYQSKEMICVMQCTSMYPIPDDEASISVINLFKENLNVSVGYSDHTIGYDGLELAASLGASALEFHFTDNREGKTFRDHQVSLTKKEVDDLCKKILRNNVLKGSANKEPQSSEIASNHIETFRRGVYLKKKMNANTVISEDDIVMLRPNLGTDARDFSEVVGSRTLKDLEPFEAIYKGEDYK